MFSYYYQFADLFGEHFDDEPGPRELSPLRTPDNQVAPQPEPETEAESKIKIKRELDADRKRKLFLPPPGSDTEEAPPPPTKRRVSARQVRDEDEPESSFTAPAPPTAPPLAPSGRALAGGNTDELDRAERMRRFEFEMKLEEMKLQIKLEKARTKRILAKAQLRKGSKANTCRSSSVTLNFLGSCSIISQSIFIILSSLFIRYPLGFNSIHIPATSFKTALKLATPNAAAAGRLAGIVHLNKGRAYPDRLKNTYHERLAFHNPRRG